MWNLKETKDMEEGFTSFINQEGERIRRRTIPTIKLQESSSGIISTSIYQNRKC